MDFVIKIGGSLINHPRGLSKLCSCLSSWLRGKKCVVTPGGGPFSDLVRFIQGKYNLSEDVAHEMALMAVDQYGLMLSSMIRGSTPVRSVAEIKRLLGKSIPVMVPSQSIMSLDLLEHSWDAGSDCVAALVAKACSAKKLILVKAVDGIYRVEGASKLLTRVSLKELATMKTCVDPLLPRILETSGITCIIVNGLKPERVKAVIDGVKTLCTEIAC